MIYRVMDGGLRKVWRLRSFSLKYFVYMKERFKFTFQLAVIASFQYISSVNRILTTCKRTAHVYY